MSLSSENTIEPGQRAGSIALLASRSSVEMTLGAPDKERRFPNADDAENVTWLSYFKLGMDVCISNSSSLVTALSLFRGGIGRHRAFDGRTREGLAPGCSESDVIRLLGEPHEAGDSFTLHDGTRTPRWISYDTGIAFEFSHEKNTVDRIAIYRPGQPSPEEL